MGLGSERAGTVGLVMEVRFFHWVIQKGDVNLQRFHTFPLW